METINSIFSKYKVALCFIINYDHELNKENIWREWIEENRDIINVYFFYQDKSKIKSSWILEHLIDPEYIVPTNYVHVIPAYMSILTYAFRKDFKNQWFSLLTDSCCPIISPRRFRYLFFKNNHSTLMSWRSAWWNPRFQLRANLAFLPEKLHLANDPWFVMKREDVLLCMSFRREYHKIYDIICKGEIANESLFAIIFKTYNRLNMIEDKITHVTDWSRMTSTTSPYVFKEDTIVNRGFIEEALKKNKKAMFIRKIDKHFPEEVIKYYLYEYSKKKDADLTWNEHGIINHWITGLYMWLWCVLILIILSRFIYFVLEA